MITQRRYFQEPPIVQTPLDDVWMVVVPVARTNEISNPSFETATTGYTAGAGSLARSTTQQYHGAYSGAYTPSAATTDGFYYTFTSTVALRGVSCKFLGAKGVPYALAYASTAPAELVTYTFIASGRWQWIWLYVNETSATSRRIYFRKNGSASTATFYVDGVQSETLTDASETVSTYIDGDQLGMVPNQVPPAYYWNGTPHASTSTRSGLTRAGGEVKRFSDYGFTLMAIIGLGLAAPQNVATEYARIDGGYDDYTRKPTRQFTLLGRFDGRSYAELRANRGGLASLLDRDVIGLDQRMLLLHRIEDGCGNIATNDSRVLCKYQGGLGGNTEGQVAEQTPITFTHYLPLIGSDGESGTALDVQNTVADMDNVAERLANGTWRNISTSFNNGVNALLYANDGNLYVAGDFTAPQTRVGAWDGTTFSAMGAGLAASVLHLVEGPDGTIYASGASVTIGGVSGDVTAFTGGAWAVVGATGATTGEVAQMVWATDGNLYAVGTNAGTNAVLYRWDGSAWTTLFTGGAGTSFFAIAEGPAGLYIGGNFTNLNADANQDHIALYSITGATWSALGTGLNAQIENKGITLGLDKRIYVIGDFTAAGGVTASHTAVWNGAAWQPLGAGITTINGDMEAITLSDGSILFGGFLSAANGISFPDPLARWNGATYVPLDADLPTDFATFPVLSLGASPDGRLAVGYFNTGAATTAATTTITNTGTARTYPTLTITGPSSGTSRIWQCVNVTTNRAIYFNYTINAGETATLVLTPDNLSFTSDFQGNIASTILPGSNVAEFFLQPGDNIISFFSADSSVTATLFWRPQYAHLDDVP